ncbi:MAG: hypothetical protein CMK64_07410 [Pseudoalteromonas sp.]|nr:hypothetical protein [Pseudoalteromonas sp.]|tara:strand:- start:1519 stop:1851 length:333 start_codon:yes stop_codon:yes gene_type:complete
MVLPRFGLFLVLFSLLPAFVPGALSIIGYFICLTGLIMNVTSSKKAPKYFIVSSVIATLCTLFINDTLRLVFNESAINPVEQFVFIVLIIIMIVNGSFKMMRLEKNKKVG